MKSLTRETLSIFWRHSRQYPWHLLVVTISILLYTGVVSYTPILYRDLIDLLTKKSPGGGIDEAVSLVVFIFILNVIRITGWRIGNFVNVYFQAGVMRDLTDTCYRYLQYHSTSFFNASFVGSLVTKVRRYERAFEQIADQLTFDFGRTLFEVAVTIGIVFWQYGSLGYILLAWCAIYIILVYFWARFKLPYDLKRAQTDTKTTAHLADSITNNVNVKLFTNYGKEEERFRTVTQEQYLARKTSWNLNVLGDAVQAFSMIAVELLVLYIAIRGWQQGVITPGDIALLQIYMMRIFDKLWNTGRNIRVIYEALADGNEMTEILLKPHEVPDRTDARTLEAEKGSIEFKRVSFGYHKENAVLNGFDLAIKPGERVALIGPSGGGKSTIVKLLFRFYDVNGGEIVIDGQNIAMVSQDSLRHALSLVPQDPILFHRSLMENIRYAKPSATDEEVKEAAKLAHAHEFIGSFSQGYDTLVGERGVKLSGGERQRVAIARAILKNAPILVLDEATSSLDSESELYIQDALKQLMKNRTTIVIAHRLSTIMQMDRIVVVEGGRITEEGKHKELLKAKKGTYQKLWGIQAGSFAA